MAKVMAQIKEKDSVFSGEMTDSLLKNIII